MRWRALALVLLVVFGALALAAVVFRSWVAAQANVVVVLSRMDDTPVLSWAVGVATGEPRVEESTVAAAPTTLLRPEGDGPWPAVVVVNGATELGRHDPDLVRFAHALARA